MKNFGMTEKGEQAELYTLRNGHRLEAQITNYGAALVRLLVPDRQGDLKDIVLGYDDAAGYERGTASFGAVVGRVANRIGGAAYILNGKEYLLEKNDGGNNLHSGSHYYNKRIWVVEEVCANSITLSLHSPDMDQGYPGEVDIRVTYTLTEEDELKLHYYAVPKEDTLMNMTNHSYFNLEGETSKDVLDQEVWINADAYTRADDESIPTGEIIPVEGTPMDFRTAKKIGKEIGADYEALIFGQGYDHNWVLNESGYRRAASMHSDRTGITMEVYTDLPGIQFYTGNFLKDEPGKDGAQYQTRRGACFETQYFPDAIHKEQFEGPVVKAKEAYETVTVYKFI